MTFPDLTPRWRRYLRLLRSNVTADVDDELRFHLESRVEDLVASGSTSDTARAQAASEFGDLATVRQGLVAIDERVVAKRDRRAQFRDFGSDLGYAIRSLIRTPGVTTAIVCTLALGVGANGAIFTLLNSVFVRTPVGVSAPTGIRRVWAEYRYADGPHYSTVVSYPQFAAVASAMADEATVAVYRGAEPTRLGAGDGTTELQVSNVSPAFFSLLGVRPALGRFFAAEENVVDSPAPVVVLSDAYWERAFHRDSSVLGTTLTLKGRKFTVIGVAGAAFTGIDLSAADAWAPLAFYANAQYGGPSWWTNTHVNGLGIIMRPRLGANDHNIEQRLTAAFRRPEIGAGAGDSTTVVRLGSIVVATGPGQKSQEERISIRLAGGAIVVLLIAVANIVNLLLARTVRRRREIAIRLALGISRARLLRLLLAETFVIGAAAGLVAVAIAYAGGTLLRKLLLPQVHWSTSPLDWAAVAFALGVALVAALLAGLVPALQAASPRLTDALRSGTTGSSGTRRSRLRGSLVVVQTALSVMLLMAALLFVRSLSNVRGLRVGFDIDRVLSASVTFDDKSRQRDPTLASRMSLVAERIGHVGGVERVALSSMEPMAGFSWASYFTENDSLQSRKGWMPTVTTVSPGYFATTGTRIVRGSDFTAAEGSSAPRAVVVNEEMARGLWPRRDAVGRCMRFVTRSAACYTVIGVVEDSRMSTVIEDPAPKYYLPAGRLPDSAHMATATVAVVRVSPERLGEAEAGIRALIRTEFPGGIPVLKTMRERLEPQYRPWRLGAVLFTAFGVTALIVALVGIYSTVSYDVTQRIHEFGVRTALGAGISDVLKLVVGQAVYTASIGVAVGIGLALAASRLIVTLLYGVSPGDPLTLASVALALMATAGVAALIPALRATRVDPVIALRAD
jgi:putative ABC transport system permease protein